MEEVADVGRRLGQARARWVAEVHLEARQVRQLDHLGRLKLVWLKRMGSIRSFFGSAITSLPPSTREDREKTFVCHVDQT